MIHYLPGLSPGATAHVPAPVWELMLSTSQVGTAAPTAPMWEGVGGLWDISCCLAPTHLRHKHGWH